MAIMNEKVVTNKKSSKREPGKSAKRQRYASHGNIKHTSSRSSNFKSEDLKTLAGYVNSPSLREIRETPSDSNGNIPKKRGVGIDRRRAGRSAVNNNRSFSVDLVNNKNGGLGPLKKRKSPSGEKSSKRSVSKAYGIDSTNQIDEALLRNHNGSPVARDENLVNEYERKLQEMRDTINNLQKKEEIQTKKINEYEENKRKRIYM
eukprot:UN29071